MCLIQISSYWSLTLLRGEQSGQFSTINSASLPHLLDSACGGVAFCLQYLQCNAWHLQVCMRRKETSEGAYGGKRTKQKVGIESRWGKEGEKRKRDRKRIDPTFSKPLPIQLPLASMELLMFPFFLIHLISKCPKCLRFLLAEYTESNSHQLHRRYVSSCFDDWCSL